MSDKEFEQPRDIPSSPPPQREQPRTDKYIPMQQASSSGEIERLAFLAAAADISLFPDNQTNPHPTSGNIYEAAFQVEGVESLPPVPFLNPRQQVRLNQYEHILNLVDMYQAFLEEGKMGLIVFESVKGVEEKIPVTEELIMRWRSLAENHRSILDQKPEGAHATKQIREKLAAVKDPTVKKYEERRANDIQDFNTLWEQSSEDL